MLAARSPAALHDIAREIHALGRKAEVVSTDVASQNEVRRLVAETLARWGRLDILVSSAGQYIRCPVHELTREKVEQSMAVNFYGSLHAVLEVLPHMRERGRGHIVIVSSMNAKKGLPLDAPYVAAKFAISGLVEVLRQELHGSGIYVSTIFPGRVATPMTASIDVPWISSKIRPETVARSIVRAIRSRRPEVILPPQALGLHYLNTLSPRIADWAVRFLRLEGWEAEPASRHQ
jgi:short-subunit dehydrogenase